MSTLLKPSQSMYVHIMRERSVNREKIHELVISLNKAAQLASIAADRNFGDDGKVLIDGRRVSCRKLADTFRAVIDKVSKSEP